MPWSSKSTSPPATLDELAAKNAAPPKTSWSERLAIKPKVIPAQDQTSLSGKMPTIGADVYVQGARMHEARGNFDQAQQQYQKAIEADPKNVTAFIGLARLHDRQRNFAEAERTYRQAAKLEPKNAMVWNDLGLCYARQKKLTDATKMIDYAVKLQPQNKMYRNNLATVLVEAGQTDLAWSHLTAVNDTAVAHYNMAYLLSQKQQDAQAIEHLEQALAADPALAPASALLAKLEGTAGTTEELAISTPPQPTTTYTITDQGLPTTTPAQSPAAEDSNNYIATTSPSALVNPLSPATRKSAMYRMPPTEGQVDDPAPQPARLPEVTSSEESRPVEGDDAQVELSPPGGFYPSRRISHEDVNVRQPNVIRLLDADPQAAPIPTE